MMLLTGDVDLHRPLPAAPGAVAQAIADELRRNGCVIRRVAPDVVEFDGPSALRAAASGEYVAATLVSSGVVWLNPAGNGRMRVALRMSPALLVLVAAAACGAVVLEMFVGSRFVILAVIATLAWFNLDAARSTFEDWVGDGARRA